MQMSFNSFSVQFQYGSFKLLSFDIQFGVIISQI